MNRSGGQLTRIIFMLSIVPLLWSADNRCLVKEHAPINSVVCSISNLLTGGKGKLYLYNFKDIFKINSEEQIVVIHNIDRESYGKTRCVPGSEDNVPPYCRITVEVINKVNSGDYQEIHIPVDIEDINDNDPTFEKHSYTIDIDENQPPGHTEHLPVARDSDYGLNGKVTYSLEGRDKMFFELIQSSEDKPVMKTLRMFDREIKERYELILVGADKGIPRRTSEVKLFVRIRDLNDNTPEFSFQKNMVIGVKEDTMEGSKIGDLVVTDKDSDNLVTVSMDSTVESEVRKHFRVSADTGITLIAALDYESSLKQFIIPIVAVDNGIPKLSASATVTINVLDVNDKCPSIKVDSLNDAVNTFHVPENRPKEAFVAMVTVQDDDSGASGLVECSISEQSMEHNFELISKQSTNSIQRQRRSYKIVTVREFDREKTTHYSVTINCKDHGQPSLSSQQIITVRIDDENDNPPVFSRQHYRGSVKENSLPGTKLITLQASDPDAGDNARTRFTIHPKYQDIVAINNPATGVVTNLAMFDREVNKSIRFQAFAVDYKNPLLNSSVDVTIEIEDENDCSPIFDNNGYFFKIKEGHTGWVGKVHAYDNDTNNNGQISYLLIGVPKSNPWVVRADGNIFSERGQLLDRETQNLHHLTIEARDHGTPPRSSSVMIQIQIEDVNDNPPRFIQPGDSRETVIISDTMPPGSLVTKVTATDNDENDSGRVTYHIYNSVYFRIDEANGDIYINKSIPRTEYFQRRLIIIAKDCGTPQLSSTLYLPINFQQDHDDLSNRAPNIQQSPERKFQDSKKRNIDGDNYFKWNSKEVLITMTVGSVLLILCCSGFLLLYMWYQSRPLASNDKSSEVEGTLPDVAINGTNRVSKPMSCLQWLCLGRGSRHGQTDLVSQGFARRQQQTLRDISQPLCDEKLEQMRRGSTNPIGLDAYLNPNSPLLFRYQQNMLDMKNSTDSLDTTSIQKHSGHLSNIYEPPLKSQKGLYTQNYSTIELPSYNTQNPQVAAYSTTAFPSTENQNPNSSQNSYFSSTFAIPNPRITNSFV